MILDLLAERLFAKLPAGCRERGVGPVGGSLAAGQCSLVFRGMRLQAQYTARPIVDYGTGSGGANLTIIRADDPGSLPASSAVSPLSSGLSSHP
jgi:hypothetical protein